MGKQLFQYIYNVDAIRLNVSKFYLRLVGNNSATYKNSKLKDGLAANLATRRIKTSADFTPENKQANYFEFMNIIIRYSVYTNIFVNSVKIQKCY